MRETETTWAITLISVDEYGTSLDIVTATGNGGMIAWDIKAGQQTESDGSDLKMS